MRLSSRPTVCPYDQSTAVCSTVVRIVRRTLVDAEGRASERYVRLGARGDHGLYCRSNYYLVIGDYFVAPALVGDDRTPGKYSELSDHDEEQDQCSHGPCLTASSMLPTPFEPHLLPTKEKLKGDEAT